MGDVLMRRELLSIVEGDGVHEVADRLEEFNPYDPDSVAAAAGQPLSMPPAQRRERHDALFQVLSHNDIQHWADRFLAALESEPTALSQLEQMPSVESQYRRLARLLLADFEYRRGYKFANTVRHFRGGVRRSTVMHLSSRKPGLTHGLVSPVVRIRIMDLTGMGAMVLNWFFDEKSRCCTTTFTNSALRCPC